LGDWDPSENVDRRCEHAAVCRAEVEKNRDEKKGERAISQSVRIDGLALAAIIGFENLINEPPQLGSV
jgi:hypothetical protein